LKLKTMFSGMQPSNELTIGNYFGALKEFNKNQKDYDRCYVFVADLHAITGGMVKDSLIKNKKDMVLTYLAAGMNLKKTVMFYQSDVLEHTQLSYLLTCFTTMGELSRMTQYKTKCNDYVLENKTQFIPTGLFLYPVLMAADILLYQTDDVIVGSDQKQHLELTRNIAERINNKFNLEIFKIPNPVIKKIGARIMDLQNPLLKMSKSSKNLKGTIFLTDNAEVITKKILIALTDNFNNVKYDIKKQPGISNLMTIYNSLTGLSFSEIELKFKDIENYGIFKKDLAKKLTNEILEFQNKKNQISNSLVNDFLDKSLKIAKSVATENLTKIKKEMGINE